MEVKALIAELLYQTNCLVLPRFGGFIANQVPARYDDHLKQFLPPSRVFTFNVNVANNDGFLIHALANKLGVSYQDAEKRVQAYVLEMKFDLDQGKRVVLDNVGFLVKNKDGFVIFEQDRFLNLLRASYGLGHVRFIQEEVGSTTKATASDVGFEPREKEKTSVPVASKSLETELPSSGTSETLSKNSSSSSENNKATKLHIAYKAKKEGLQENKGDDHPILIEPTKKSYQTLKKIARVAAVAALLPMAFYSLWIPMKTDFLASKVLYMDDFNPFQSNLDKAAVYFRDSLHDVNVLAVEKDPTFSLLMNQLSEGKKSFVFPITEDRYFHVTDQISTTASSESTSLPVNIAEKPKSTVKERKASNTEGFHLIAGCFGDLNNAQKQVDELKIQGFDAFIVDQNKGLHRVSAAFSVSRKDLESKRTKLKNSGINAWVLKK
jgi:hypothetical protein